MKGLRRSFIMTKGLRRFASDPFNSAYLNKAQGVRIGPRGLELPESLVVPSLGISVSHPMPQLIHADQYDFVVTATRLYSLSYLGALTTLCNLTSGSPAHIADFSDYVILSNGVGVYHNDPTTGVFSSAVSSTIPLMRTLCRFRGRVVGGNISGDWYGCDSRFAVWSDIGNANFVPDWKNEAGFINLNIGPIITCQAFGDNGVVFYGEDGVALLTPQGNTFGVKQLSKARISGREAVSGGVFHLFCDLSGRLYVVNSEGVSELGYLWVFENEDLSDVVISYDEVNNDFYISNGIVCYLMTKQGLSQLNQIPTSVARLSGVLSGPATAVSPAVIEVHMDDMNLNLSTLTSMEFIELSLSTNGQVYVADKMSYQNGEKVVESAWKYLASSSFGYLGYTAQFHRPKIKVVGATRFHLDTVNLGFKLSDNRIQNQLQTITDGGWSVNQNND